MVERLLFLLLHMLVPFPSVFASVGKIHPEPPNLPVATSFQALGSRSMHGGVTKTHIGVVDAISRVILCYPPSQTKTTYIEQRKYFVSTSERAPLLPVLVDDDSNRCQDRGWRDPSRHNVRRECIGMQRSLKEWLEKGEIRELVLGLIIQSVIMYGQGGMDDESDPKLRAS
ncbi:hypothetical protein B0H13DRAFT_1863907 [Mycena leptocephala]|nr:hypothetical protein B0H13DRAFT_1863907 [Mycena leptocephala]